MRLLSIITLATTFALIIAAENEPVEDEGYGLRRYPMMEHDKDTSKSSPEVVIQTVTLTFNKHMIPHPFHTMAKEGHHKGSYNGKEHDSRHGKHHDGMSGDDEVLDDDTDHAGEHRANEGSHGKGEGQLNRDSISVLQAFSSSVNPAFTSNISSSLLPGPTYSLSSPSGFAGVAATPPGSAHPLSPTLTSTGKMAVGVSVLRTTGPMIIAAGTLLLL